MKKYFRDRMHELVKLDDPPHKLALAFAIGVFIAFSPWLGLHILSCFFFAWIFRVSKVVVLTGSFVNNPWTLVPMYAFCLWAGFKLTGSKTAVPDLDWSSIGFWDLFTIVKPFLWPFVVGTLTVGALAGALSYILFFCLVKRYRSAEAGMTSSEGSPD